MIAKRGTELTTNLGEKLVNDWWQMFVSLSGCFGITEVIFENLVPPQFRLRNRDPLSYPGYAFCGRTTIYVGVCAKGWLRISSRVVGYRFVWVFQVMSTYSFLSVALSLGYSHDWVCVLSVL
jgi:hypothetical protein